MNCQPKLLLLDLKRNGTIIHRYNFPDDVAARGNNYLNRIVIDDASGGFAYITDNSGADPGLWNPILAIEPKYSSTFPIYSRNRCLFKTPEPIMESERK